MNINHLRYFEEVCKQGSVTKAAEICHISQPSITAAINGLEQEFGYKLFYRVKNHLQLTEEGENFLTMTRSFLNDFNSYYEKAKDLADNRKTTLRIGIPAIMGTFFFQKLFPDFNLKHPDIMLDISEIPTIHGLDKLNNAELDFVLGIKDAEWERSYASKLVFETNLVLAVSAENQIADEKEITSDMLSKIPLVLVSKGSYHYTAIRKAFQDTGLNVIMQSTQLSTIKYMVENDYAGTIIYRDIFLSNPRIRCIPLEKPMPAMVHLFWQKNIYTSVAMRKFIRYITHLFPNHQ